MNEVFGRGMKWICVHGEGTIYRLSIFKFGGEDHPFLKDYCGYGEGRHYIGAIVWSNRPKFIYDNPGGFPPSALRKAGLMECSVLEAGWKTILNRFDEVLDGSTIQVAFDYKAVHDKFGKDLTQMDEETEFVMKRYLIESATKIEIVPGWENDG